MNSVMEIIFETTKFPPKEWNADMLRLGLTINPRAEIILISINGAVAGCCSLLIKKDKTCKFELDYVLPEFRGMGLHRYMLAFRIAYCYDKKVSRISAICTEIATKNYLTFGFIPVKFLRNKAVEVHLAL